MNWSFTAARVAGIDIKIHWTFALIIILGAIQWGAPHGAMGALFGATLMLLAFVCVTLHELGHSLVAKYFDIPVRQIILLPLGGIALLERNPKKPMHELLIAVAGPLVNVVIALVLFLVTQETGAMQVVTEHSMVLEETPPLSVATMLFWLLEINILLVAFNMIPAFPLDGGRVLRAVLAMAMGPSRATRIATFIGQAIAIVLGVLGILNGNFLLALIAIFIFFGAGQEGVEASSTTVLSTQRVGDAYNKHVLNLAIGDRIDKVIDYILTSYQPDFAVMQGDNLLGIVTRDDVLKVLANPPTGVQVPDMYATMIMQRNVFRVDASESLDEVRQKMTQNGVRVVAVYDAEQYLGLVSIEDIAEAFTVLRFAEHYNRHNAPPSTSNQPDPQSGAGY